MDNLIEWLEENIYHTTTCDKHKRKTMQCICGKTPAIKKVEQLQAKVEGLKRFLDKWDGHESNCGRNREGFEGCDERMFDCSCGYEEAKREALKGK